MSRWVLALDLGASSGRAILAEYDGKAILLHEVHRFRNEPLAEQKRLYWNFPALMQELEIGMRKALLKTPYESIGIDTWGVDYGLLDQNGALLGNPRHYRDGRSTGYCKKLEKTISAQELYRRTGTQIMDINTLFQLMSERDSSGFRKCRTLLLMPDLLAYFLTGDQSAERSIASTTQMLSAQTGTWDTGLLEQLKIPASLLPPLTESGSSKGTLSEDVQKRLSLPPIPVTAVCGHDTQCAAFAAPAKVKPYVFLSCGTWSLFGTLRDTPVLTEQAAALGLSNEVGYGKKITFLKNIIGLWLIQEAKREYERQGMPFTFAEIEAMAASSQEPACYMDPDDPAFTPPGNLPARLQAVCRQTNQPIPQSPAGVFRCFYESLAMKYRTALEELEACTGETYPVIHLMGGGARDHLLCQLTATYCQRPVIAGPVEATVYGNAAIQLLALGAIHSPEEAKAVIAASEPLHTYTPGQFPERAYHQFQKLFG